MGITDGTFICALCGEGLTGCSLCGRAPLVDLRAELARQAAADREAERELQQQSASISRRSRQF